MDFVLTIIMCGFIDGQTTCMRPHTFEDKYKDAYSCILDGYTKSHDKIVEIGREEVNLYNIYLKFGCNENKSNKTAISSKQFK